MKKNTVIPPVGADVISDIVAKLIEETEGKYAVAAVMETDWCPCCGINFRMRDQEGKVISKFIVPPAIAKTIALDLLAKARRAQEIVDHPDIRNRAMDDVIQACLGVRQ